MEAGRTVGPRGRADGGPSGAVRVFLVDDHAVVRAGLRALLEGADDVEVVGESGTAAGARAAAAVLRPDVAVLDARLPDGSGIEVCRALRTASPGTRSLVLTSYDDDQAFADAVEAGARGYLLKEIGTLDLVASVRAVARGASLLDPQQVERVRARLRDPWAEDPRLRELTAQERRVLALLSEGRTNREIGLGLHLSEKTVKNYVTNVLAKLGLQSRTQAALYVTGRHPGPG